MLFNTLQFVLFLIAVLWVHRLLPRGSRNGFLLGASLLFYTLWTPVFLLLLLADIGVNYALLQGMRSSRRPRVYLIASLLFTFGLLAWYKYAAFLLATALPVLRTVGAELPLPQILLPLGISFYSFQIAGFSIDSYRRPGQPLPSLGRYALFVSFFPQLIAGPILRGSEFLPQLDGGAPPDPARARRGVWLLASGAAKKIVVADFLLAPYVERVFDTPGVGGAPVHWLALWGFAFQLYFDFSGYTDIARGVACLLGFELPLNFREPYLSRNPTEFWRRWHMTLTAWLRDYIFVPTSRALLRRGSPRGDRVALDAADVVTMLLCGLWHGAGWNFVAWGGLCGAMLVAHRRAGRRGHRDEAPLALRDVPRIALHFNAFCLTLVLFRSSTLSDGASFAEGLFRPAGLASWPALPTAIIALCVGLHVLERWLRPRLPALRERLDRPWGRAFEAAALGAIAGLACAVAAASSEFIYFQF